MSTAKKVCIGISIIIFIMLAGIYISLNLYLSSPSQTPQKAIQKYVFKQGNPIEAFNLQIRATEIDDGVSGQQYTVRGFYDNATGMEIMFFYLKKCNNTWQVISAGTGP